MNKVIEQILRDMLSIVDEFLPMRLKSDERYKRILRNLEALSQANQQQE